MEEQPVRPPQRIVEDEGDDEFLEELSRQEAEDEQDFLEELRLMQENDEDEAILSVARQRAGEEAQQTEAQRKKLELEKSIKDGRCPSLDPLREKIDMAKKPRCRTIEQYLCDRCDFVIAKATDGFVIEGNIYTADPTKPGGLIGNNFPEPEEGKTEIPIDGIKKTVLCKKCLLESLGFAAQEPLPRKSVSEILEAAKKAKGAKKAIDERWLPPNHYDEDNDPYYLPSGEGV